jgi:hypothetical protein
VGHGLFRFKKRALDGVFKSAGRTRWENRGSDDVNPAWELLTGEINREVKGGVKTRTHHHPSPDD